MNPNVLLSLIHLQSMHKASSVVTVSEIKGTHQFDAYSMSITADTDAILSLICQ